VNSRAGVTSLVHILSGGYGNRKERSGATIAVRMRSGAMGREQSLSGATMTPCALSGTMGMEKTRAGAITVAHASDRGDDMLPGPLSAIAGAKTTIAHKRLHFVMADSIEQGPLIRNDASVSEQEVLYRVGIAFGKDFPDLSVVRSKTVQQAVLRAEILDKIVRVQIFTSYFLNQSTREVSASL